MSNVETTDERQGWDVFWRGSLAGAAFEGQGVSHPAISRFWTQQFEKARQKFVAPQLIDLASGTGAVLEHARSAFSDDAPRFTSIDLSPSAARILRQRAPDVLAVIADVGNLPFFSGRFDIVTSQFE